MTADKAARVVAVVGNGPVARDLSERVEAADIVVRFNEPKASIGMTGSRTDILFVCNSGNPMRRRLNNPNYTSLPTVQSAREVILPYHPLTIARYFKKPNILSRLAGKKLDLTAETLDLMGRAGKAVTVMPPRFYEDGCRDLGLTEERMKLVFPSTGFFGIRYALERFAGEEWRIEFCGFSWEGWSRHAWADERAWISGKLGTRLAMIE